MSRDLEERLRALNPTAPDDLKSAALRAAAETSAEELRPGHPWIQLVGAVAAVLVLVVIVLNVTAAPAHNLFSNISAGLGT